MRDLPVDDFLSGQSFSRGIKPEGGSPSKTPAANVPAPKMVAPGIWQGADGKLSTGLPLPKMTWEDAAMVRADDPTPFDESAVDAWLGEQIGRALAASRPDCRSAIPAQDNVRRAWTLPQVDADVFRALVGCSTSLPEGAKLQMTPATNCAPLRSEPVFEKPTVVASRAVLSWDEQVWNEQLVPQRAGLVQVTLRTVEGEAAKFDLPPTVYDDFLKTIKKCRLGISTGPTVEQVIVACGLTQYRV